MPGCDTLVHNFLHRTGLLHRFDANHVYGLACYRAGGCADIIQAVAERIDARQFNASFPKVFPRFVQHAIWRYCSLSGLDVCNGNRIDDSRRCDDLRNLLIAEGRPKDLHSRIACDRCKLGNVGYNQPKSLDVREEALEATRRERHRKADGLGPVGAPCMRDVLRQEDQIAGRKDEGPLRRPDDNLTLDQLDNLIVPLMKVTWRPKAGRRPVVENGELSVAGFGTNPDMGFLAP